MRHKTELTPGMHRGFKKGIKQATKLLSLIDYRKLRTDLRKVIGGETGSKLHYYIYGKTIVYPDVALKIEKAFKKRKINPEDIWDN